MSGITDRNSLVNYLYRRLQTKDADLAEMNNKVKNLNQVNVSAATFCASKCLNNFGEQGLNPKEESCLTSCSKSFYEGLETGEIKETSVLNQNSNFNIFN